MSVSGLCEICERPDVEHTCDRCGRLVCDRHYDAKTDHCVVCARELGEPGDRIDPDELPDDVDVYRF